MVALVALVAVLMAHHLPAHLQVRKITEERDQQTLAAVVAAVREMDLAQDLTKEVMEVLELLL